MDSTFAQTHSLVLQPMPVARKLFLADGVSGGIVQEYVVLPMRIGNHYEFCLFYITTLAPSTPVILGLPWLQKHNPSIDWTAMTIQMDSWYCLKYCCLGDDKILVIHRAAHSNYKPPSCVDHAEDRAPQLGDTPLDLPDELTPGRPHYRTRNLDAERGIIPECRAIMIRNSPPAHPEPAKRVGGRCITTPKPRKEPLPALSIALPQSHNDERPDLSDIRLARAVNFVQFCKQNNVYAMKVTWEELDQAQKTIHHEQGDPLPDLSEQDFQDILQGQAGQEITDKFPPRFRDFIHDCNQALHLRGLKETDIEKFMAGKAPLTDEELRNRLPDWLRDMMTGFLTRKADELPPRRAWDHKIDIIPGREPPYQKNRPFSPPELLVVRKWLDDNLDKGFIRESRARCAAPLLLASKPGGGVRICQDYRGLNNVTIKNRYPLPLIRETLDALCNAVVYTKLDIIAAFNKLRIAEGHEWKTAFITRFGLFESLVMPFGLCNAPASFQNYINHTLHDLLDKTCTAYLDDVLIYSSNKKDHRRHVREVVQRLIDAGLQIDIDKCEFEVTETKYLGLIVSPGGIKMDPEKVATIRQWTPPPHLKDLQKFLGFANFYRRFIRDFSKICAPLNKLMRKDISWNWGPEHTEAFETLKKAFATAPVLAMYDFTKKTILETDASDWASGGVLSQYDEDGVLRPVAYFSRKHSATECNYEIYDKELLAIIKSLEEWRPELQGTTDPFEIITDHKNLEFFTTTKALSQRQVRWSEFLSQFNFRIVYRPGAKAVRPDALSRMPGDRPNKHDTSDDRVKNRMRTVLPPEVLSEDVLTDLLNTNSLNAAPLILPAMDRPMDDLIASAYATNLMAIDMTTALSNPTTRRWPKHLRKILRAPMLDFTVRQGRIWFRERLFAPPDDELRTQILYRTHNTAPAGHPGRVKTTELVTRDYWWPRMSRDIETYVQACELCVRTKSSKLSPQGFLKPLPVPFRAWSDISVDYITPLPDCIWYDRTYKHVLVVVCRLTKMRHIIPVSKIDTSELVDVFISRVYSLHGCPDNIVSDRGTQFVSQFWNQLSTRLGVTLKHSSSFHPETDGQTERVNSSVEAYLRAFMNFHQDDWVQWLPLAEFAMNNVVSETTGTSPFFANYGFHPKLGIEPSQPAPPNLSVTQKREFFRANNIADRFNRIITQLKAAAKQSIERYEHYANENREDAPRFTVGDLVFVDTRNMKTNRPIKKCDDKMAGPYKVLKVYDRACALELPPSMKIFPVFHNSLLRLRNPSRGLSGQNNINEAESRRLRGRVLEREDGAEELTERWEFECLLDCHDENPKQLTYLVKWKHHPASWQLASDLKGQENVVAKFHSEHPDKPGPRRRARRRIPVSANLLFMKPFETYGCLEGGYCHSTNLQSRAAVTCIA
jgi:hypothetical protein